MGSAHAGVALQHWTLANGAQVYLAESPAIPMVDVQIDFDAGSRRDPPAQAGLAQAAAAMTARGVRASGALPALDENALAEAWVDLGASFAGSASADRLSFGLRSLAYPDLLGPAAELAARQMAEPAFSEAVWQRERARQQAALKEAQTRPATRAGQAFAEAVFGAHPYGNQTTVESLARIGVDELRAAQAGWRPCHARISLVGALNRAQAEQLAQTLLARLPGAQATAADAAACPALPALAEVAPLAGANDIRVPFESAQAHVLIGQPGPRRADPDFFALLVGNYILGGGGFVSRLTTEVREQRGLSYSVYSYFSPGLSGGAFTLGLQTRPDQAWPAVQVAREVVRRFVEQGPTEAELRAAKANLVGGFALRIDSNRKLLDQVANIAQHGLPLDYLDTWTQAVEAVSVQDVRRAFARAVQPQRMVTVVVGGAS